MTEYITTPINRPLTFNGLSNSNTHISNTNILKIFVIIESKSNYFGTNSDTQGNLIDTGPIDVVGRHGTYL